MTPADQLADALPFVGIAKIIKTAGISQKEAFRATAGRPLAAIPYLRLCVALHHDPLPELPHAMVEPGDFAFELFGVVFLLMRAAKGHSRQDAAEALCMSMLTIGRIEGGRSLPIGALLRACQYVGWHPFGFMRKYNRTSGMLGTADVEVFLRAFANGRLE